MRLLVFLSIAALTASQQRTTLKWGAEIFMVDNMLSREVNNYFQLTQLPVDGKRLYPIESIRHENGDNYKLLDNGNYEVTFTAGYSQSDCDPHERKIGSITKEAEECRTKLIPTKMFRVVTTHPLAPLRTILSMVELPYTKQN